MDAPAARGSGCGQRCRRTALLRALTCGNCLSGARSAKRVLPHRSLNCVTQVCPERSAGTQKVGSHSLGYVSSAGDPGAGKKGNSPAGARPGLCKQTRKLPQPQVQQALPAIKNKRPALLKAQAVSSTGSSVRSKPDQSQISSQSSRTAQSWRTWQSRH